MPYTFGDDFQRHCMAVLARVPGAVLRYRSALDHAYFGSKSLRLIGQVLFDHVDEYRGLPTQPTLSESVKDRCEDDEWDRVEKVMRRIYREDVQDAPAVLNRVIEFGRQQAYENATIEAAAQLDRGNRNIEHLFRAASLVGEDLLSVGLEYKAQKSIEDRQRRYANPETYEHRVRTGLPHLDYLLKGGLRRGELGVILAPPKRGKSTTLINIGFGALTAAPGLNVAHYSLEMDEETVGQRYDDRLMGSAVKFRRSDTERYNEMLKQRIGRFVRGQLFVRDYPTRSAGVGKIRSHLSLLAARGFMPDLVIADYADIMQPERRLGETRHEQAGIYEDLRQLAGEFGCVVWTGSQASRAALEKDVITIEDFAESFEKAAIVDAALAFCQTRDEKIQQRCRLFAAALRNSEDGRTVECEIRRDMCRLKSVALFDVAGSRIRFPNEVADPDSSTERVIKKGQRKRAASALKESVGIKKKARRKFPQKSPTDKRKPAKRKRDLPTKKVE